MAFPNYAVAEFTIVLNGSDDKQSVEAFTTHSVNLSTLGFTIINPWNHSWQYREGRIPKSAHAFNLSDKGQQPVDMVLRGHLARHDDSWTEEFRTDLHVKMKAIEDIANSEQQYVRLNLRKSGATENYRRYVQILGWNMPAISKTRLLAYEPVMLRLRCLDPYWYHDAVVTETMNVVNGTGAFVVTDSIGNHVTERCFWEVIKNGADNVVTPTITMTGTGDSMLLNDTLSSANERFMIDVYTGKVRQGTSAVWASNADAIGDASGQFPRLTDGSDTATIVEGSTTNDFQVKLYYIPRVV